MKGFLVLILVLIILGAGSTAAILNSSKNPETKPQPAKQTANNSISPHVLVYGSWTDSNSEINAYDLSTQKEYVLANLPKNIKKVSVISPDELLYINNTDDKDHGEGLTVYSLKNKTSKVLYKAEKGFGIDDYVLSPNKRFIADWEVRFEKNSSVLYGANSRVYSFDLSSPTAKNLIYDEIARNPIHYPRAVTSTGEIFFDTFLPNSNKGWAYGMSVSDLKGGKKEDVQSMQNGTYSTQPVLSPDEKYLAFAGYDGSFGSGISTESGGVRFALLKPNTIELLDTRTMARTKLSNISNTSIYPSVIWDKEKNTVVFTRNSSSETNASEEFFWYDFSTKTTQKIPVIRSFSDLNIFLSSLSDNQILVGKQDKSFSTMGNLGENYQLSYKNLFTLNTLTFVTTEFKLNGARFQYIALVSSSTWQGALASLEKVTNNKKSLQLETFSLKPSLALKRFSQQSIPRPILLQRTPVGIDLGFLDACTISACIPGDSPLYLYGLKGEKVKVSISTSIFSSKPFYSNGYDVTLRENGLMEIGGGLYERIKYDYKPAIKVVMPERGKIVSRQNLVSLLSSYAGKLGLNKKETDDLIEYSNKVNSPYVFVSFFDQKTSKAMLPVSFNPAPDTYINIVFYFKPLQSMPEILPPAPKFESVSNRSTFTAVEISSLIDK